MFGTVVEESEEEEKSELGDKNTDTGLRNSLI